MFPVNTRQQPHRKKRKRRQVNWKVIIALLTVIIQVGGRILQVWMEGRGGRL